MNPFLEVNTRLQVGSRIMVCQVLLAGGQHAPAGGAAVHDALLCAQHCGCYVVAPWSVLLLGMNPFLEVNTRLQVGLRRVFLGFMG